VPNTGDTIGVIWGEGEYEFQTVQRRYFLNEFKGDSYWVVVVRDADPSPQFDMIVTNALLTTDAIRSEDAKAPLKEVVERIRQLEGAEPRGKRYKPAPRMPDEPHSESCAPVRHGR
jgi:hypothetical protein